MHVMPIALADAFYLANRRPQEQNAVICQWRCNDITSWTAKGNCSI
jgi:hypothetical protein